jgi:hypothetical protein
MRRPMWSDKTVDGLELEASRRVSGCHARIVTRDCSGSGHGLKLAGTTLHPSCCQSHGYTVWLESLLLYPVRRHIYLVPHELEEQGCVGKMACKPPGTSAV